jgi:hypothetical protein
VAPRSIRIASRRAIHQVCLRTAERASDLNFLWDWRARELKQCRRDVDVERDFRRLRPRLDQLRVAHQQRHADRLLVRRALVGKAMLAPEVAVVAGEDDDRVVGELLLIERFEDRPSPSSTLARQRI